jgi:hypothetical protein
VAPGVHRLRQDRLNDDVLIQGNIYVLLLPPGKAVVALDGHVGVALGYVALVFAYFSKKPLPLVDGSNVASIASEVLPRLTQVRKLFVLSLPVLLLYLAVLLLLLVIFLLTSCKGCCFPDVGLAPPAVAAAIVCTTLNFVNVRYYPPFLQYNFERTIF